ncbi:Uncharacterised protein [Weissella viridescens]|uniref:Uncharacterized protein n=1 Tax=Weissella viridescens TaxID=1629 RepID=A0A380NYM9_WEIVI|nr:Uncharacterised protein [Weissella viridescens]
MKDGRLPREGEFITIKSYKHDGSLHRTWRDTMVLKTSENELIGLNDHTVVIEDDGRRWVTREPAIVYFHKNIGLILSRCYAKTVCPIIAIWHRHLF